MKYAIGGLTRFKDNPSAFETRDYSAKEKALLLAYMQKFGDISGAGGYVDDLKTGEHVYITNVFYQDRDGYTWSTQDMYHIKKYNAAVNEQFLVHVQNEMNAVKNATHGVFQTENAAILRAENAV